MGRDQEVEKDDMNGWGTEQKDFSTDDKCKKS